MSSAISDFKKKKNIANGTGVLIKEFGLIRIVGNTKKKKKKEENSKGRGGGHPTRLIPLLMNFQYLN